MSDHLKDRLSRKSIIESGELQQGIKKKTIVGAGFSIFAQTANYTIQTIGTIIMARLLLPEDFGLVTMVVTFSLLIQNFGLNGFTEAVVQRQEITQPEMSRLFWVNLLIMSALTAAFIAFSPLIVWFYKEPQLKRIAMALAFTILFGGLSTCHLALLTRNMKFKIYSMIQVGAALFSTGLGVLLAARGYGYWSLVLRRLSLPLITAVLAWLLCRWLPSLPGKGPSIRPLLAFGFKTYGNFLLSYVRNNLDRILIGKAFGKAPLGNYDRANQLSSLLPNQLTIGLSGVGVAALSRLRNDPKRYLNYFEKSLSILSFVGFPGSILLTLIGKDIIIFLLGSNWSTAGDIFVALGPAIGVFVIYSTSTWLHISLGRPDRLLKWSVGMLIASALAYAVGLQYGPLGVAIAYSTLFYILLVPALHYAGKPINIKVSFYLSIIWKYWLASFLAGAITWSIFHILGTPTAFYAQLSLLARITLASVIYLLMYLGLIYVLFKGFRPLSLLVSTVKEVF
ncbi:MAG: lipopolysaccharide biosynthesis protein [Methanosarcinaceae archaeon]|nr:lipopolysaccharide biosynthesis protein [Methanosarcinaceae archaeon]